MNISPLTFFLAVAVCIAYTWLVMILIDKLTFDPKLAEPDVCPRDEDLGKDLDRSLIRGAPGTDTDPRKAKSKAKNH